MNSKLSKKIISGLLLCTTIAYAMPVLAYTKDETVFSKTDNSGKSYKTIVSAHLKNTDEQELLKDMTNLFDIKNTNGEETFSQNGEAIIWNSNGKDIYYQGESKENLPIDMKISYKLDDKDIASDEIIGKSGKVTVNIQYTNNEKHTVIVNGKRTIMYTPFMVAAGTIINNSNNSNIEISSGKVVNKDDKSVALGICFPGMNESLNISKDKLDLPSNIEITMDSTNFELGSIITVASPKVFEDENLEIFDKLDSLYDNVNTIKSSSNQIEEGAKTLADGTQEYSAKSKEFNDYMNSLSNGANNLDENYTLIDDGVTGLTAGTANLANVTAALKDGVSGVAAQLSALPSSVTKLYGVSNSALIGLNGDGTKENPGLVAGIDDLINSSSETAQDLIKALKDVSKYSEDAITILESNNKTLTSAKAALDANTNANLISSLETQITNNKKSIETYKLVKNTADKTLKETEKSIKASETSIKSLKTGVKSIQAAVKGISDGLNGLQKETSTIPTQINGLTTNVAGIANGAKKLNTSANSLQAGSVKIKLGINSLNSSAKQLYMADNQLTSSAETISDGANTLYNGIQEFNSKAINPICNFVNGDLKNLTSRAEKLQELSKQYKNFSKTADNNEIAVGNVNFVIVTDKLEKKEN